MNRIPLTKLCAYLRPGSPLPWNILDASGSLLLAKGYPLSAEMLATLLERETYVDRDSVPHLRPAEPANALFDKNNSFFTRWALVSERLGAVLRVPLASSMRSVSFVCNIEEVAASVSQLVDQHTDELLFAVMRHDHSQFAIYPVTHSLHAAAVCSLLAQRMQWAPAKRASLVAAALTMNISMLELQGQLAARGGSLSPLQAKEVQEHPSASVALLRAAGVTDVAWLSAVQHHHEQPGGAGYPNKEVAPCELSQALRLVDIFTAKHASRAGRAPMAPRMAAQALYLQNKDQAVASLLIKEFGLYPPGCLVKLANGETAVVVRRSALATAPMVAAFLDEHGSPLAPPVFRQTSETKFGVTATILDAAVDMRLSPDQLYAAVDECETGPAV